jgi:hypothetical protein
MKTKQIIVYGFLAVMFALLFVACSGGGGKSLNSATELKEYLDKQPGISPDKPIKVAMKVNDMMLRDIVKVIKESNKYVSLDLSGSPLTEIPRSAFYECKTLAGITIPKSVASIGNDAFSGTGLTSITVGSGNPNYASEGGILYNKAKTEIVYVPIGISGKVTIPNGVTSIREDAFANTGLTSVTIPNSVTEIGRGAFRGTSLTSVTIPNSVTEIGTGAFRGTSLTSITIPASVTEIDYYAFNGCTSLTSVTFQGTILESQFEQDLGDSSYATFPGDLRAKYLAGGIGTYTRPNGSDTWAKQ